MLVNAMHILPGIARGPSDLSTWGPTAIYVEFTSGHAALSCHMLRWQISLFLFECPSVCLGCIFLAPDYGLCIQGSPLAVCLRSGSWIKRMT